MRSHFSVYTRLRLFCPIRRERYVSDKTSIQRLTSGVIPRVPVAIAIGSTFLRQQLTELMENHRHPTTHFPLLRKFSTLLTVILNLIDTNSQ